MLTPETNTESKREVSSETERIYESLMELYPYVRNVVRRKIGDIDGWEDVVQEVYASCLLSFERVGFNGQSSLKTWVYTITMRRVYDCLRQNYKSFPVPVLTSYLEAGVSESPEDVFQKLETREKVESGFFVLAPRERKVFVFLLNDWEIWEVAHVMKVSTRRISELRASGLRKLRKFYGVENGRQTNSSNGRYKRFRT